MNKNKIIRGINKYLTENVKKGSIFGGVKFISIDKKYKGFYFDFEGKEYKVFFYEKMDRYPEKSFIRVFDFTRDKPSLVQYTLDTSTFIEHKKQFNIIQNRGATIGRKVVGLEEQFNNLMHSYGFSKENIISVGTLRDTDYKLLLNDIFYWLKLRIKTKLKLEEKYRDIENESDDSILDIQSKTEGGMKVVISTKYERDPILKKQAIAIHGTKCKVCNFDFTKFYGNWAKDYIEVHHMKPLSESKGIQVENNPAKDLTVVCSNCHRMIHKNRDITLTIEELKNKIKNKEPITINN